MYIEFPSFLVHWFITAVSLWIASHLFRGIKFSGAPSLIFSALLLGFANAIVKPIIFWLTIPLTLLTLGAFLLVINALMISLVSSLVRGFEVSGFWTACFASLFVSAVGFFLSEFFIKAHMAGSSIHHLHWVQLLLPLISN